MRTPIHAVVDHGAAGVRHAVQRDGRFVQVVLRVDPNRVDELLVLGNVLGRLQILVKEGAHRPEVDV